MTSGAIQPILDFINAGGVLAVLLLLGYGFYTGRLRLGSDYDKLESQLNACLQREDQLWLEKIQDKDEKAELARAYLKIREADKA